MADALKKLFKSKKHGHTSQTLAADLNPLPDRSASATPVGAMDTFFISHGSPMTPLVEVEAKDFWRGWQKFMPNKPKAILAISAHWHTRYPSVNSVVKNETIHDFYGFPAQLYKLKYNAPGAPDLAARITELLKGAGFSSVCVDSKRGLDHGAWVPLYLMYPNADVPVCQLSVQLDADGKHHYKLGKALAPLTREGVLIIGSGSATHNLRTLSSRHDDTKPAAWALEFDNWLNNSLTNGRFDEVIQFEEKAPHAKTAWTAHPTPDHFLPLLVALGAAGDGAKAERIHTSWMNGTLSMASFAFRSSSS
eukprot:c34207_g1_i1 orf=178-1098(+)